MLDQDAQLTVEMFPASHGDSFLLRIAHDGKSDNVLVDAGPRATYTQSIRPRLVELAAAGEDLRALIVTHIDADHIEGAIEFLEENGPSSSPSIIGIQEVWHNSYRHVATEGKTPTEAQVAQVCREVSFRTVSETSEISARQGSTLAALIRRFGYPWNVAFGGAAAVTGENPRTVSLGGSVELTILSPRPVDLAALARMWRRQLISVGVPRDLADAAAFEEAFEQMVVRESELEDGENSGDVEVSSRKLHDPPPPSAFREDRSKPNASSIAFLLEVPGKRALFLGDAHPSTIAESLRKVSPSPIAIDVVKLSHHGSRKNTSPDFCSTFRATHALVSTDGSRHGHPDVEALLWLVDSQPGVTIHFNHPGRAASEIAADELTQRYGHRVNVASSKSASVLTL